MQNAPPKPGYIRWHSSMILTPLPPSRSHLRHTNFHRPRWCPHLFLQQNTFPQTEGLNFETWEYHLDNIIGYHFMGFKTRISLRQIQVIFAIGFIPWCSKVCCFPGNQNDCFQWIQKTNHSTVDTRMKMTLTDWHYRTGVMEPCDVRMGTFDLKGRNCQSVWIRVQEYRLSVQFSVLETFSTRLFGKNLRRRTARDHVTRLWRYVCGFQRAFSTWRGRFSRKSFTSAIWVVLFNFLKRKNVRFVCSKSLCWCLGVN